MPYWWEETSFLLGAAAGVAIATVFGFLLSRVQLARGMSRARFTPQWVGQSTRETPAQVVRRSIRAVFQWLFWGVVLVGFVGLVIFGIVALIDPF